MRHEKHRRREGEEAHARSTTGRERRRLSAHAAHTCLSSGAAARGWRPRGRSSKLASPRASGTTLAQGPPPPHLSQAVTGRRPLLQHAAMATAPSVVDIVTAGDANRALRSARPTVARLLRACLFVLCLETAALLRLQQPQEANWCGGVATPSWLRRTLAF
ncbi:hypothetical protein MTO96_001488 [Rhipicephalus appendiculatus]